MLLSRIRPKTPNNRQIIASDYVLVDSVDIIGTFTVMEILADDKRLELAKWCNEREKKRHQTVMPRIREQKRR